MKTRLLRIVLAFVFPGSGCLAAPRDTAWQQVDEAVNAGRPQTAIEQLEPIITGAMADKAYAEAIKAIGQKIALEGVIQGNKPEEKIVRLQAEMEQAPAAMQPTMEALLAHWYWHYFQRNRWRFLQRTQTAEAPGPDLQTWDLARILAEIDRHFTAALADAAALQAVPIREFDALLERGSVPDRYRPTLFDFLAYQALEFYQTGEQAAVTLEDEFELEATSPIFAPAAEFMRWRPSTTDSASPKLKAIALFQSLLAFHESDSDRSAFHDADLARLTYGHRTAVGEAKEELSKAALQRFIAATGTHEVSTRAVAFLAGVLNAEGDPAAAHVLARRGSNAFPRSAGAAMCFNLIHEIEAPSVRLETESVWNPPWPTLDVTYRNVTKVYFRALAVAFDDHVARARWGLDRIDQARLQELLARQPALAWSADLPRTRDFKQRTERLATPTTLKPGFYHIIASHDRSFGEEENQVSVATVWVADLALVVRTDRYGTTQSGFVLHATSGEPIAGATVRFWRQDQEGRLQPIAPTTTDENGQFQMPRESGLVMLAEHDGHAVSSNQVIVSYNNRAPSDDDEVARQTVFFTDRAIYRPGQTISYKGICLRSEPRAASYQTLARESVTVLFRDPNGSEIARATHQTNDYGSFSGMFTAPRDRVMGQMMLLTETGPQGVASIRVEEYKRPKFQVALAAPLEAAKLDAPVVLTGTATAYTGAAIGGAKVKWRVERSVQFPYWCWWWQPPAIKAVAHGTALTNPDGTFTVEFPAVPDRTVPARNEPTFVFTVSADVTDTSGETRSADRGVRAGYTALQASVRAEEWQTPAKPVEFVIATNSLDGDPQPANGTVTVHSLRQPPVVQRASLHGPRFEWGSRPEEPPPDPTNPDSWALGDVIFEKPFATDRAGAARVSAALPAGIHRVSLETTDRFGRKVTARQTVQVVDPQAQRYGVKLPNHFASPKWSVEPGEKLFVLWGTGYDSGRAFVELECDGKALQSYWTAAGHTQERIEQPVTEEMRGGITVRVTYIRENRAYLNQRVVDVPWSNQQLTVKWESFRSKLLPGQNETWTAVVSGPDAERSAAEMVAALYDASLDQFVPHAWPEALGAFRREFNGINADFQNSQRYFQHIQGSWQTPRREVTWRYRDFPARILANLWGWGYPRAARAATVGAADGNEETIALSPFMVAAEGEVGYAASAPLAGTRLKTELTDVAAPAMLMDIAEGPINTVGGGARPDLSKITARRNLNETAFFFPHLIAGDDGVVRITFTMPEALTEWKFLGFAHDQRLRAGFLSDTAVTAKDLMVEPNPPRFVREGDVIEFTVKVSNQSDQRQAGTVRLTFADASSLKPADDALANRAPEQPFDVPGGQSRSYTWRITVPDGMGFLTYKAVAASAQNSDGEEGFVPVLSRRILVAESLPLPIRGPSTRQFEFQKLLGSGASDTLRHQSLTVQMTSQPAWYAVMALPYLIEYPYECSEQVFNRLYANALARHVANSDPRIRRLFDLWQGTPTLDSPLAKNQDLKSVMLEETPWLRQASAQGEARRNMGVLFDDNRLDQEIGRALHTLAQQQLSDGLWSWFPGGRPSRYISLYITTGFGRLRRLGVTIDQGAALKSLAALDTAMAEHHRAILKRPDPESYVPDSIDALYLYGRSFFLSDQPIGAEHREAVEFFLRQSRQHWLELPWRQSQAHLALALQRFGDQPTAQAIVRSLKERSVRDEELGMFWRDQEWSWWWYRAPIETQALMIEAFSEIGNDLPAVDDCQVWLLKQKQTQDWKTTKATADAIYGLLLRGDNLLASDALVEVALAGRTIKPDNVEAGTGYYEQTFVRDEIKPAMGQVTVTKVDEGVSWGGVHWQYLEDIAHVTPHEGTPLTLKKTLFVKETTGRGQVLKPVAGPLTVGDELVVRIELRTDRDMEFVHLKDQRGSGTEPVNVLSRYKYQDGLAYYETTRDTASHFFIDYLPKGTYVFEYSTRIQLRGRYQSGIAAIQCMYAPEFNSHSESVLLEVN